MIQLRCPQCSQAYNVAEKSLGTRATCRKCGQGFVLQLSQPPGATTSAADGITPSAPLGTPAKQDAIAKDTHPRQAADTASPRSPRQATSVPQKIGRFEIRQPLGQGSFGAVYRAYDPVLKREVALKVPHVSTVEDPEASERFLREARAAAQLTHPNIVPIYDAGTDGHQVYIASAFIAGETLDAAIKANRVQPQQAVEIVRGLAEALAYAHEQEIIHRDVKPANVMLDRQGRPHLMDFGLARLASEREKLTHDGSILGTPAYMSPEQAGSGEAVGPASDQYSLGVILYELITGQRPFEGPVEVVIFNVRKTEPSLVRSLRHEVSRDLETICHKAMAKEPGKRFANCRALAEDLRRYASHEPIQARRIGNVERLVRWCRRNPLLSGLASMSIALLVLVAFVSAAGYKSTSEALGEAERNLYSAHMVLAQRAWEENQLRRLDDLLDAYQPASEIETDLRGFEWYYWRRQLHLPWTLKGHRSRIHNIAFSPDGRRIVSSSGDNTIKVWDIATSQEVFSIQRESDSSVKFSPDGRLIVGGGNRESISFWDATTGKLKIHFEGHSGSMLNLAMSSDGQRIVSSSYDKSIKVWDAVSGDVLFSIREPSDPPVSIHIKFLAYSPDNLRIVGVASDSTIRIWDATSANTAPLLLEGEANSESKVAFSPDGQYLIGGSGNLINVWEVNTGNLKRILPGHDQNVTSVAFSPDGSQIVSGSADSTIRVWDVASWKEVLLLRGHLGPVSDAVFSPDGRLIASCGSDGTVKLWLLTSFQCNILPGTSIALSPDGQKLATGSYDQGIKGTIKVWDISSGKNILTFQNHADDAIALVFSPDGRRIISGSRDDEIKISDATTGKEIAILSGHADDVRGVAISQDIGCLASGSRDGIVKLWDLNTGQELLTFTGHENQVTSVAINSDGRRIVSGSDDTTAKVWDATNGREVCTLQGHTGSVSTVIFTPDGKQIISGSEDKTVRVWDAQTGQELFVLRGHQGSVTSVNMSLDGKRIVSGSGDATIKFWEATNGQELLSLKLHSPLRTVAFDSGGNRLISTTEDGTVRIWDATKTQPSE